jgi:hypothetical protein
MVQCPAGKLAGFFMRFTIRDLIWLVVVVGLAVGWWLDHQQFTPGERDAMRELRKLRTLDPFALPPESRL